MRKNRVDKYHHDVVVTLEDLGCSVQSLTSVKDGCPDLLVGIDGKMALIEVKTGNTKPRENQLAWHAEWRGPRVIVLSVPQDGNFIIELCLKAIRQICEE